MISRASIPAEYQLSQSDRAAHIPRKEERIVKTKRNPAPRTRRNRLRWLWVWLIQIVASLLMSLPLSMSLWLGGAVHAACMWGLSPILGFISALVATRKGLLNHAAWIAPPVMLFVGYLIAWGYPPQPGPVLLCAFISLVGAATGEVCNQQQKRKK